MALDRRLSNYLVTYYKNDAKQPIHLLTRLVLATMREKLPFPYPPCHHIRVTFRHSLVERTIMPGLHSHWDSPRQDENESVKGICLVFHTLDLLSSCLEALGDMLVNQSRVKGNKNVMPRYRQFSHESVNVYTRAYFVSSHFTKSLDEYPRRECKPDIKIWNPAVKKISSKHIFLYILL